MLKVEKFGRARERDFRAEIFLKRSMAHASATIGTTDYAVAITTTVA